MAEALATHRFTSREAAQLYAAWRDAAPAIRQRILEQPQLYLKAQRQREPDPPADGVAELLRDLEMVAAITRRAIPQSFRSAPSRTPCAKTRPTAQRASPDGCMATATLFFCFRNIRLYD